MEHSFEVKMQGFKDIVVEIGKDFTKPDDDWRAMMIMEREDARALVPLMWGSEQEKDFVANNLMPAAIRLFKPDFVAQVTSAWSLDSSSGLKPEDLLRIRPSQHPARIEIVVLMGLSLDQLQFWSARIQRSETAPPTLANWEMWPTGSETAGQFIDPIRDALYEVHHGQG